MFSRRFFLKSMGVLASGIALSNGSHARESSSEITLSMPDESAPHERTWMAFVANDYVWSRRQIPEVKRNLIDIARTIAKYEPVSMLVSPYDIDEAAELLGNVAELNHKVELIEFDVDDLWLRDTGPTFVKGSDGQKYAIDFNFNGWGNKQDHELDAQVAGFIAQQSGAIAEESSLVLEGGCFEVDGEGTAIMTRSCIVNDNRNPGVSEQAIEGELKELLGLKKIIWLDGIKGKDITDGHTDFYARFIKPGQVLVSRDNYRESYDYEITRENIEVLQNNTDAHGRKLDLVIIDTPDIIDERFGADDFAAGYIGYYVCNGAVIAQMFGDKTADNNARRILEKAFPDRVIEQIAIDGIASGGGSIHCATQQEIKL